MLSETIFLLGDSEVTLNTWHPVERLRTADALPCSEPLILISALEGDEQDNALKEIHQHKSGWCWKIYTLAESRLSSYLSDGQLGDKNLDEIWLYHSNRLSLIKHEPSDPLLGWLWLDSSRRLLPLRNSSESSIYTYPLAQILLHAEEPPYNYLNSQVRYQRLEQDHFVDRIRNCPSCNSGHLNYTETCPHCHSNNLTENRSLHCFTCGHVDKEQRFRQLGKLNCPNCSTQLRHIGVDYDRPLEVHACLECGETFSEAETRVHCLDCAGRYEIPELITRHLYSFKSGEGMLPLIMYGHNPAQIPFSTESRLSPVTFEGIIAWMNRLGFEHRQKHTLIALNIKGTDSVERDRGSLYMNQFCDGLYDRIQGELRDTDIASQYRSHTLCLFLPVSDEERVESFKLAIKTLGESVTSDDIALEVACWDLPDPELADQPGLWLNEKLTVFEHE